MRRWLLRKSWGVHNGSIDLLEMSYMYFVRPKGIYGFVSGRFEKHTRIKRQYPYYILIVSRITRHYFKNVHYTRLRETEIFDFIMSCGGRKYIFFKINFSRIYRAVFLMYNSNNNFNFIIVEAVGFSRLRISLKRILISHVMEFN